MRRQRLGRLLLGGVATAGAATATGLVVRRQRAVNAWAHSGADQPLGSLSGPTTTVVADDGVPLYVEVDEPDSAEPAPTLVFLHGWVLNRHSWHYQRAAFRGANRLVFYDHRAHGRSGRSDPEHCTFEQLARDLARVIEEVVPDGPIVLVGHSMGGMAIMSFADQFTDLVLERVVGVALLGTSGGDLAKLLPGRRGEYLRQASPALLTAMGRAAPIVELGRRLSGPLAYELTRRLAFGTEVPASTVAFVDAMITANPTQVFTDFYPEFTTLDMADVIVALRDVPTLVAVGDRDALTPVRHSQAIAELLPDARLEVMHGIGHMLMLERPEEVNRLLRWLLQQVGEDPAEEAS